MEDRTITLEQLLAGGLLRFEFLDEEDINVLKKMFYQKDIRVTDNLGNRIERYIELSMSGITLSSGLKLDSKLNSEYTLEQCLQEIEGPLVYSVLKRMDMELFLLNKIVNVNPTEDEIKNNFNREENIALQKLLNQGLVEKKDTNSNGYKIPKRIIITQAGLVKLFIFDNYEKYRDFVSEVLDNNRDISSIEDYLMKSDLGESAYKVFFIDRFLSYCNEEERAYYINNSISLSLNKTE